MKDLLKALLMLATLLVLTTLYVIALSSDAKSAGYSYSYVGQSAYPVVKQGQTKQVTLTIKNTGTIAWCKNCSTPTRLGTSRPMDRASGFSDSTWDSANRIPMQESTVAPGSNANFVFNVKPNDTLSGTYREYFQPVVDGVTWLPDIGIYWDITVPAPVGAWFFNWYPPTGCAAGISYTPQFGSVNGCYSSADISVIDQQLDLIVGAGIEFISLDIWPNREDINSSATLVANRIISRNLPLKFTFTIEPGSAVEPIPQSTYDSVYAYESTGKLMHIKGKPLLIAYYPRVAGNDSRFATVTFSYGVPGYPQLHAIPATNSYRVTSLMGSYDDCAARQPCTQNDKDWTGQLYNNQRDFALANRGGIDMLMIYSWNEYPEGSAIEPNVQHGARGASYLYDLFKNDFIPRWNN